ncbi:7-cyano-7-deazaguanine synthase QueC [Amycolatopsis saalfeldensis]|uniref:7-cyano-7-deazaguanine synthase QueC n=1 Tax=Amycolatopsis saalfeldensis TaxID=394193 RepID=UPI0015A6EB4A|nr:7-cyano-7-deazaguanine synthase QueC [Amycolatopsis saalfeldensis]
MSGQVSDSADSELVLRRLMQLGASRGSDGAGVAMLGLHGSSFARDLAGPLAVAERIQVRSGQTVVLMNSRLEPTSEHVPDITAEQLQPYQYGGTTIVHNGIVANDHELRARYGIEQSNLATRIDSGIIPNLLVRGGSSPREQLVNFADEVVGSYALAVHNVAQPEMLTLACSFKPLWMAFSYGLGSMFFASESGQLRAALAGIDDTAEVTRLEPYSGAVVDATRVLDSFSLDRRRSGGPALCVCSGGMDSTTAAALVAEAGQKLVFCNFQYGCRAEVRERRAVEEIAEFYGAEAIFPDLRWLGELGGSTLTSEIDHIADGDEGVETAHEWVPARNLVLIAHAVALCERYGFGSIVLGTNEQEGSVFPDNELEFIETLSRAVNIGSVDRITIASPVGRMSKRDIVRTALQLNVPLHLTWSCYRSGELPCGSCGSCLQRRIAFHQLGLDDPRAYATPVPASILARSGRPA